MEQLRVGRDPRPAIRLFRRAGTWHRVLPGADRKPYNPDFAAWARAAGVEGLTVTKSQDFKGALEHAVKLNKPCLLDVTVDANIRPPSTGAWALPPIPHKEPVFGRRHTQ